MSEFLNMGGYATYVWGSYAAGLVVFVWNLAAPRMRRREVLRKLRAESDSGREGT
jgi:heme exporter protein D